MAKGNAGDYSNNKGPKRKRKRLSPNARRTKKEQKIAKRKVKCSRRTIMEKRALDALKQFEFICKGIIHSKDLLQSLVGDPSCQRLRETLSSDIRGMEALATRHHDKYSASSRYSTFINRCKRIRTINPRRREKLIQLFISRRRKGRNSEPLFEDDSSSDSDYEWEIESDVESVDSEIEDATYIPEVFTTKRRRKRQPKGKRGNNESTLADRDEIFAEEIDGFNDKYQFAIDLKNKDKSPGKFCLSFPTNRIVLL